MSSVSRWLHTIFIDNIFIAYFWSDGENDKTHVEIVS